VEKEMGRRILAVLLLLVLTFCLFPIAASADTVPYFTFGLDTESAPPDGLVRMEINANRMPDTAAGFRMMVDYDADLLSFVRTETSSQIKTGTMMTNSKSNPIRSVYVCDVDKGTAPVLSGNIISFVFKVRDDAPEGRTEIGAHIDQICNFQAKQLNLNYDEELALNIDPEQTLSGNAYLRSLMPLAGSLTPHFSSDVFEYEMSVDSNINTVEFGAAAGDGGTVKINRKTLGRAGTDTVILATVTSANKKARVQYAVTVHRRGVPAAESETEEISPAPAEAVGAAETPGTKSGGSSGRGVEGTASAATAGKGAGLSEGAEGAYDTRAAVEENPQTVPGLQPPAQGGNGNRNIYIIGNQMPSYVVVLLAVIVLIELGILLAPWLNIHPKKKD
jgi:Cohesin domain.